MKNSAIKRALVALYETYYEARRMFILRTKYRLHIMSWRKTIRYIKRHRCSIARFGDGEFDLILGTRDLKFQNQSDAAANALAAVLDSKNPKLLLCIPRCFNTIRECNDHAGTFWIEWGRRGNHHQEIVTLIRSHTGQRYLFGDSQLTRPYIDWKSSRRAKATFAALRGLWRGRDILIVEGRCTCLGVGNDLFDDAASITRIIAPPTGAFEKRDEILSSILAHHADKLIIMALGPTATVLASELADRDIQALDIGHIDIEYEWYRMGATERVQIPGKFTNEAKELQTPQVSTDPAYLSQIIDIIE